MFEERIIVLMGPATRSTQFPGCVERPTQTFVLNVELTTNEQRAKFDADVAAIPCLGRLKHKPWGNGDTQIVRFTAIGEYGAAVQDVHWGLARKHI